MTSEAKKPPVKTAARREVPNDAATMPTPRPRRGAKFALLHFGTFNMKVLVRPEEWAHNIDLGQTAMKEIKATLVKPGVKLRTAKGTPLFRADPDNPGQIIRVLDGKEERGVFQDGSFKPRK